MMFGMTGKTGGIDVDAACETINEDQHVDSTNTRVSLPQPPNCNPKATEFEVKNNFSQNSSLIDSFTKGTYK
ncbi:hypothetical protein HanXRQr2_Chr16g0742921 [Helianthus annuus]|uniref:Uncharacterized protein n=1 Tax=Helianthus annuus TaxID=4232 RepID=A0A9K3DSU4_HELAN|nr:hypothetical protein HanXRQr2_Chr16g0742921 [Helianthus annuus]